MRLLITGAGGQLGCDLTSAARSGGLDTQPLARSACDIATEGECESALDRFRPDVVVNCAAWTAVDRAEDDPDGAFRANAVGPRRLAGACHARGIRLCHVSTDFVFDGQAVSPIDEWAPMHPLGVYGASKAAGEQEIRHLCPRHVIVRTAWLYGADGPNFVLTMLRLARERPSLRVVADQIGSPTWTGHLAPALLRLLEQGVCGTFHLTNSGSATWHELAVASLEEAGMHDVPVEPITTEEYPTRARRPGYSVLDNRAWRLLGEPPLPHWRAGLRAYLGADARIP